MYTLVYYSPVHFTFPLLVYGVSGDGKYWLWLRLFYSVICLRSCQRMWESPFETFKVWSGLEPVTFKPHPFNHCGMRGFVVVFFK